MRVIWKYDVMPGSFTVEMPRGAKLLSVHCQSGGHSLGDGRVIFMDEGAHAWKHDGPRMWALVDPAAPAIKRRLIAVPTGEMLPGAADINPIDPENAGPNIDTAVYVGTFIIWNGRLVFHLFDLGEEYEEIK